MIAATEDDEDDSDSVLSGIEQKVVVTDLINQLDIADGLKELLISGGFTLKSLLNTSAPDFAKILGIDQYVAKLVSDAVSKAIKMSVLQTDIQIHEICDDINLVDSTFT